MNIDNGKSIENFNDIPEFYKEIINCWVEFGGGQTKTPTNFREIRNQNIWGNKKFNNKSLIYKNWIDSNLLYVNDITDENGRVLQDYLILIEKLKNEINFFSEFSRLKKAISKEWYVQLSEEKSVKTTINIKKEKLFFLVNLVD